MLPEYMKVHKEYIYSILFEVLALWWLQVLHRAAAPTALTISVLLAFCGTGYKVPQPAPILNQGHLLDKVSRDKLHHLQNGLHTAKCYKAKHLLS